MSNDPMFKFKPLQYVHIHHFGLNCDGRVIRCIQEAGPNLYSVDYCLESTVKRGEFYEDELSEIKKP